MKMVKHDIIDAVLFLIVLSITIRILTYFGIDFNILYVVAVVLVVWVVAKMSLRRFRSNKKDKINTDI